jgi:RecB family exonuclease
MAATWGDAAATQGANRDLDAIGALFDLAHRLDRLGGAPGVAALLDEVNDQRVPARRVPVELGRAGVAALTAHRAKGRQWPLVVVAAVQDGVWPAARRRGSLFDLRDLTVDGRFAPPTIGEHLAAERRLFYVACTRAQDSLVVTAVDQVGSGGLAPSRFLSELGCPIVPVGPPGPTPTTWIGFIGLLRRTAADPTAHPTLRAAACLRLADLAEARDAAGRQLVPLAAPERWWGSATAVAEAPADVDSAGAPIRLSGSQVDGLLSCPRQWFLARRARAERDRSPGAVFGTLVHTLAQQLAAGVIDRPTASRRLDEVWPDIGFPAAWQGASEREQAEAALDRFEVWQHAQVDRVVLGLEVHFETSVRIGQRTVRLTGQIDRLDRTADGLVRVVDFKTAKVAPSKAEAAANHQLGVYQLAIQTGALGDLLGPTPRLSDAELVHVRLPAGVGQPGPKVARQASLDRQSHLEQPDPAALGRLTERSVGMPRDYPTWVHHRLAVGAEILAEGRYPAVAQRSCRWCQFRSSCPIQVADEEEASV